MINFRFESNVYGIEGLSGFVCNKYPLFACIFETGIFQPCFVVKWDGQYYKLLSEAINTVDDGLTAIINFLQNADKIPELKWRLENADNELEF